MPADVAMPSSILPPVTPLSGIATVVNAGLGLAALLRQDVSYSGSPVSVDALAFEMALAGALKELAFEHVLVPALGLFPANPRGRLLSVRIQALEKAKLEAWQVVRPLVSELVRLDTQLDIASRAKNQAAIDQLTAEINTLRADLSPVTEPLAALDQRWSELQGQWQKLSPDGLTGFARLLRAEALQVEGPLYLHAAIVSSGGHRRIRRSLWRSIFTGDNLTFTGGAVARWAVLDSTGEVKKAGLLTLQRSQDASPSLVERVRRWWRSDATSRHPDAGPQN
jgi:hypothetical protein